MLLHSETRPFLDQVSPKSPSGVYCKSRKEIFFLSWYQKHRNTLVALRDHMRGLEVRVGCSTNLHYTFTLPLFCPPPLHPFLSSKSYVHYHIHRPTLYVCNPSRSARAGCKVYCSPANFTLAFWFLIVGLLCQHTASNPITSGMHKSVAQ